MYQIALVNFSENNIDPDEPTFQNRSLQMFTNSQFFSRFTDTLLIQFEESATQSVALAATGFGSTIVTEPRLEPLFDFGPHFSQHDTVQEVVVFNKGRRLQRVHFKLDNFVDASCSTRKGVKKQETNALNKVGSNLQLL